MVDCGPGTEDQYHCGDCGTECGGECHWVKEADYCVHTAGSTFKYLFYYKTLHSSFLSVHMAPPFLSLSSSGIAAQKFPEAMGIYKLSQTTVDSHKLVGYSLKDGFYFFKDYSQPSSEFVTKVQFSRNEKDLILFRNESGWFMKIQRLNGKVEFVEDQTVTLEPMKTRVEHGNVLMIQPDDQITDLNPRL